MTRPSPLALRTGLSFVVLLVLLSTAPPAWAAGGFVNTGPMVFSRFFHAAVPLDGGHVLLVSDGTAERYDPATGFFTLAASLTENRGMGLTATVLDDGRVLIVGGQYQDASSSTAEIYDPVAGTLTPTGGLSTPRSFHTATRLLDGRVLIAGGHKFNFHNSALATAELYDPATGTFATVGSMAGARESHTTTLLPDGRVLVTGGYDADFPALSTAELYDPSTQTFAPAASMAEGRANHSATPLPDGTILVAGGHNAFPGGSLDTAEVYDPIAETFTSTGTMTQVRGSHAAASLSDGRVLLSGGYTGFPFTGSTLATAEIYDPASGTFTATAGMHAERGRHTATTLPNGTVLVSGGLNLFGVLDTAEVFSPELVDTQPPQISVPGNQTVVATSAQGVVFSYFVSVTDDVDPNPQLDCAPASGSTFPIGTTIVSCSARDASGNTAAASFDVTVVEPLSTAFSVEKFGSVDPHSGLVTVRGQVSCSRPTTIQVFGSVIQVIAQRAELRGFFFTLVECAGPSIAWSASATAAPNGRFKSGKARVEANTFACDAFGSCDFKSVQQDLQLR